MRFSGEPDLGPPAYAASGEDLGIEVREIFAGLEWFATVAADTVLTRAVWSKTCLWSIEQPRVGKKVFMNCSRRHAKLAGE